VGGDAGVPGESTLFQRSWQCATVQFFNKGVRPFMFWYLQKYQPLRWLLNPWLLIEVKPRV